MTGADGRRRRGRLVAAGLILLAAVGGGLVLYKGALLSRPQGDFGCFARGAWAVRAGGAPLYRVVDNNGWHYNYPPLFAILLAPLADPPQPDGGKYLPYPLSLLLFYALNVAALALAAHLLAGAAEGLAPPAADADEAHRRWWRWRVAPALACAPAIGLTLVRSQVQVLLLLLVAGMIAALVRRRGWLAGACVGAAIVLKVFPAFLLLVPVVRRDGRGVAGAAAALVLGLAVIPVAVFGPRTTLAMYDDYAAVLIKPALGMGTDRGREAELIDETSTQSQSFQSVLHKTLHLGSPLPPRPAGWVKLAHLLLGGLLTLALLVGRDGLGRAEGMALFGRLALLALLMVMLSPVCHLHYFTLAVPLVLALLVMRDVGRPGREHADLAALGWVLILGWSVPMVPGLGVLRDVGVPLLAALLLWVVGYRTRWAWPTAEALAPRRAA